MGRGPVRIAQLVSTFGPGSIVVDKRNTPLIVCGPDYWYRTEPRRQHNQGWADDPTEFAFTDWRLVEALGVHCFRKPPDFRRVISQQTPPPNANLQIATFRLPRWYYSSRPGADGFRKMKYVDSRAPRDPRCDAANAPHGVRMYPSRFISICTEGHIDDFPFRQWIGCNSTDEEDPRNALYYRERGGDTLDSIEVRCSCCGIVANLGGALMLRRDDQGGIITTELTETIKKHFGDGAGVCHGSKPWIHPGHREGCGHPIAGAMINAGNVFYPRTATSVYIPQVRDSVAPVIAALQRQLTDCREWSRWRLQWTMNDHDGAAAAAWAFFFSTKILPEAMQSLSNEEQLAVFRQAIEAACNARPINDSQAVEVAANEAMGSEVAYRRVEYNALRQAYEDPKEPDFSVRTTGVPGLSIAGRPLFNCIRLVEKLRVSQVFLGFDRLEPSGKYGREAAQHALGQLYRARPDDAASWLPGVENRGEGVYIELNEAAIAAWIDAKSTNRLLEERLKDDYMSRLNDRRYMAPATGLAGAEGRRWTARYLLVHGLAHALINQFVFYSGYGSSALRERLFVSADLQSPMAAMLIYTAGDSEGTLGGLVRLGRQERLEHVIRNAIRRITWCSSDPVCSEVDAQAPDGTNKAACHACLLLPETACETGNRGLDRAVLVGTPDHREAGFFSAIADEMLRDH